MLSSVSNSEMPAPTMDADDLENENGSISITNYSHGDDDLISVDIHLEPNGGLTILDYAYGPLADELFGEGQDVEHWVELDTDSVSALLKKLVAEVPENPAEELARILAVAYSGDTRALSAIKALCDKNKIAYEEEFWPF